MQIHSLLWLNQQDHHHNVEIFGVGFLFVVQFLESSVVWLEEFLSNFDLMALDFLIELNFTKTVDFFKYKNYVYFEAFRIYASFQFFLIKYTLNTICIQPNKNSIDHFSFYKK